MVLWFAALSVAAVALVFRDPTIDYRVVAAGAVLPDVADLAISKGVGPAHTLLGGVVVLTGVMLGTIGRRPVRKRLLGIPIGMLGHLVLDGVWSRPGLFWWPLSGESLSGPLPTVDRGWPSAIILELIGIGVAAWFVQKHRLSVPARRRRFLATGTIS